MHRFLPEDGLSEKHPPVSKGAFSLRFMYKFSTFIIFMCIFSIYTSYKLYKYSSGKNSLFFFLNLHNVLDTWRLFVMMYLE